VSKPETVVSRSNIANPYPLAVVATGMFRLWPAVVGVLKPTL